MNSFEHYFSEAAIIRELCKARVKLAKLRHERQFFHNIRPARENPASLQPKSWNSIPLNIFPPRRQWHSFRPDSTRRAERSSVGLNLDTLFRATLRLRNQKPAPQWACNLQVVIRRIRSRALKSRKFKFSCPIITPLEKSPGSHEYRPLVQFLLEDKVIDCLTAKYLRESFDQVFEDSCLAFRCGHGNESAPTIHDALARLVLVNQQRQRKGSFIAECDIKGFFDCVSHQLVLQALKELVLEARETNPRFKIAPRAVIILRAYLNSYAFSRDVNGRGLARRSLQREDPAGKYKWPVDDLRKLYGEKRLQGIGIPQGGAISCFIANLVLHKADRALKRWTGRRLLYMRYCDDMILIAADLKTCRAAFNSYRKVVRKLLLPVHPPKLVQPYSSELKLQFWNHKSNSPYHWASPTTGGIPWIQFVGYQVRFDGLVRVRPKSLKKEFNKIRNAAADLLTLLTQSNKAAIRKTGPEIKHRFRMKLISMAVGRRKLGQMIEGPLAMCWTNGFKGLLGRRFVSHSLKALDRCREHHIRRVEERLKRMILGRSLDKKKVEACKYYGHPFSYSAQFPASHHTKSPLKPRTRTKVPAQKAGEK